MEMDIKISNENFRKVFEIVQNLFPIAQISIAEKICLKGNDVIIYMKDNLIFIHKLIQISVRSEFIIGIKSLDLLDKKYCYYNNKRSIMT